MRVVNVICLFFELDRGEFVSGGVLIHAGRAGPGVTHLCGFAREVETPHARVVRHWLRRDYRRLRAISALMNTYNSTES